MSDQQVLRTIVKLYQIADAGEKGFATAAANMPNPALKILFKLYAQQRMAFKTELAAELRRLGVESAPQPSIPGAIHRGRVAIFAGMSDQRGQERVILKESALGERAALRAYQSALAKKDLPEEIRTLIERQYVSVVSASDMVNCLRDDEQRREAVRLASSPQDARDAVASLIYGGVRADEIETLDLTDEVLYQGKGATLGETVLSGAFGGMLWGGLMGIVAGFGVVQTTNPVGFAAVVITWLLTTLAFMAIGALISSVLAFFIGVSIGGEDSYQYDAIRENAHVLVHERACGAAD